MKKTKVLFSGVSSNIGGVETFLLGYIRHMDPEVIGFDLLCSTEMPALEEEFQKLGVTIYKVSARSKNPFRSSREIEAFFQTHAGEYDVFWCNKCMLNNLDYLKYAKKYGIPVRIIHSHNSALMDTGLKGKLIQMLHEMGKRKITSYATHFWACSDYAARWFYSDAIIAGNRYAFIPNATDVERFRFQEEVRRTYRAQLGLEKHFVVGHVGRFHMQKNHVFMIDIFAALHRKKPDSVLMLIGQGELEQQIKEKAAALGLADAVKFMGVRKDVPSLMQAMDCFLLPSLFEGLPVVAVEAQASGLPCYLAENGTTRQTQITDQCHFLNLQDAPEVWAEAILEGITDRVDTYGQVCQAGFEIRQAARQLQQKLCQID